MPIKEKTTNNGTRIFSREETFDEVMSRHINYAMEDDEYYYAHEVSDDPYDNSYWVIDKKTYEVFWTYYTELMLSGVLDKAKKINIKSLKRTL